MAELLRGPNPEKHRLIVGVRGRISVHELPATAPVLVGSSAECQVCVPDAGLLARHAALRVAADRLYLDLLDGTASRASGFGETFFLGSARLIARRQASPEAAGERIYFDRRLAEELSRAVRSRSPFALLHLWCDQPSAGSLVAEALRACDVTARVGQLDHHILLVNSDREAARRAVERLLANLRAAGARTRLGLASFPDDGESAELLEARAYALAHPEFSDVRGAAESPMAKLHVLADRIAAGRIPVLITGETGAGKEVLAERIHRSSPRAAKPLIRLHCAALPQTLLESELFGYERGAFTGAVQPKQGLLELADGGTVFLDEIGELTPETQVKLLRVLETHQILRVGGLRPRQVDCRIVAATNRNLESLVAAGIFRADLYYRLKGISFSIPPLRERLGEVPELASRFLQQAGTEAGRVAPLSLAPETLVLLMQHCWPGNIRELRNVIERAVLLCSGDELLPEHLPVEILRPAPVLPLNLAPPSVAPVQPVPGNERDRLIAALQACAGNQSRAAKMLGVSRRTLINRIARHDLPRPRKSGGGG